MRSVVVGALFVVDLVVDADAGVGDGDGSLLPGVCISPPNANIELEITTMAPRRRHRNLFIVLGSFWRGGGRLLNDRESLSLKIITSLVADVTT